MAGGYKQTPEQEAAFAKLKHDLNHDVNRIVPQLFAHAVRAGKYWEMSDADGNPGQAFKINADGNLIGIWTDFKGTGLNGRSSGDMLALIVHRRYGGDFGAAVKALRAERGLASVSKSEQEAWQKQAIAARSTSTFKRAASIKAKAVRAKHIWLGGVSIKGTPAQAYLESRAIDFGVLGGFPGALRYRPDIKFCPLRGAGPEGLGYPAMIAAIIGSAPDVAGEIIGVHATFLDESGATVRVHKVVRGESHDDDGVCQKLPPALLDRANPVDGDIKSHKATLGAYQGLGGYIPLRKGACGKSLSAIPAGLVPRFSEGIEDGLSYAMMGHGDDWVGAAISLGNMGALIMPAQAGGIAFLADRNDNGSANDAWQRAVARQQEWFDNPDKVLAVWPSLGYSDFNDELQALAR